MLSPISTSVTCQHWTLLAIAGDDVRYYETLHHENQANRKAAARVLELLRPDLKLSEKSNRVSKVGSTCGFWVMRYMEEEIRELVTGQRASEGWPDISQWRHRMQSLTKMLTSEVQKVKTDEQVEEMKRNAELDKGKAKMDALKKTLLSQSASKDAKDKAQAELDKIPVLKRCYENLTDELRLKVDKVTLKPLFVCGSCRYLSSCLRCDPDKALAAALKKQFGNDEPLQDNTCCSTTICVVDAVMSMSIAELSGLSFTMCVVAFSVSLEHVNCFAKHEPALDTTQPPNQPNYQITKPNISTNEQHV